MQTEASTQGQLAESFSLPNTLRKKMPRGQSMKGGFSEMVKKGTQLYFTPVFE